MKRCPPAPVDQISFELVSDKFQSCYRYDISSTFDLVQLVLVLGTVLVSIPVHESIDTLQGVLCTMIYDTVVPVVPVIVVPVTVIDYYYK